MNFNINSDLYTFIDNVVLTEKYLNHVLPNGNQRMAFDVDVRLNKRQLKKMFGVLLNAKVIKINSHILPIKKKRLGLNQGFKKRVKRVILTLDRSAKKVKFTRLEKLFENNQNEISGNVSTLHLNANSPLLKFYSANQKSIAENSSTKT